MSKFKVLIIDDEAPARLRIRNLLEDHVEEFTVLGEASNGYEAVEQIEKLRPDVIFLDIRIPGKDGFEVIEELSYLPRIIFCTAYEEYAVKAFDVNGLDYLVKPVRKERMEQALQKLKHESAIVPNDEIFDAVKEMLNLKQEPELTSLPLKIGDKVVFVNLSDILAFIAEDKYVNVVTRRGKTYLTDHSLKKLEMLLPGYFIRVHRSIIVNRNNIQEIRRYLNSRYILVMNDEKQTRFTSGRMYADVVKGLMNV